MGKHGVWVMCGVLASCGGDGEGRDAAGSADTSDTAGSTGPSSSASNTASSTSPAGTSGATDGTTATTVGTTTATTAPPPTTTTDDDSDTRGDDSSGGPTTGGITAGTECTPGDTAVEACDDEGNDHVFTCDERGVFVETGIVYGCTSQSEPGAGVRVCPGELFTRSCWPIEGGRARVHWACQGTDDPAGGGFTIVEEDYCTANSGAEAGQHFCPGEVIARNQCPTNRRYYICPEDAEAGDAFVDNGTLDCNIEGGAWEPLHRGVEMRRWFEGGNRFRAIRADLCDVSLRVAATTYEERGQRTSQWAAASDMIAAINGGFFLGGYAPDGCVAFGRGEEWPNSQDTTYRSFIAFGPDQTGISITGLEKDPPYPGFGWMEEAVCGGSVLVQGGVPLTTTDTPPRARSAAGLSADGNTLYLLTVDEVGGSAGLSVNAFAPVLADLGVDFGINLDGGGSTSIYANGWGLLNNPSDGSERVVSNHLGIFIEGGLEGRHCSD